ncbi:MAG: multidrug efflux RND transporter permease subunit [Planctomycetes bacterium]|nr:multidrug efflux RND transporter permease subunit [Planctomycetota bacterium]
MFSRFFIRRPVFATVLSILIVLAGLVSYFNLPVAKYPDITPPVVHVAATYPGASAQVIADTVATPIEEQVNGVDGMMYMSSTSASDGSYSLDVTFRLGVDPDIAAVLVQNRVNAAEPRLPEEVTRQGITTMKQSTNMVAVISVYSPDARYNDLFLANYVMLNINDELKRIPGVGDTRVVPAKDYGMRIWLDPNQLKARNLTTAEVVAALREQNVQVAAGQIGQPPVPKGQVYQYTVTTLGRLSDVSQFQNVIVKTNADGAITRLSDVARVELGAKNYDTTAQRNGQPSAVIITYQSPGANAVEVAHLIRMAMEQMKGSFPPGLDYEVIYDTSQFVTSSLDEVYKTLYEAVALVVLVVLVFLQNWRATLIPIITIPVSLIGTFFIMDLLGFSINTLTLFGLVLAIGIVVDDAIVVVENVERNMAGGKVKPRDATERAMGEVTSPIIATSLVLMAVFGPTATMPGISGQLYKQFALTIAVSTAFSALNALTLSPAMCAVFLKAHDEHHQGNFFTRAFNAAFDRVTRVYHGLVALTTRSAMVVVTLGVMAGLLGATAWSVSHVPTGFVPQEDLGFVVVNIQLPDAASQERTQAVLDQVNKIVLDSEGATGATALAGFSVISGNGSNYGTVFVTLKPWEERKSAALSIDGIIGAYQRRFASIQEAAIFAFSLPAIDGLGNASGFDLRLQDKAGLGRVTMEQVANEMAAAANSQSRLRNTFTTYRAFVPQVFVDIDRTKVKRMNIPLQTVFDTMQSYLGSTYVNDFNKFGKTYQVSVQAEAAFRSSVDDIARLDVRNLDGNMIPLGTLAKVEKSLGAERIQRYNLYPAATLNGEPAPGVSSGQSLAIMEQMAGDKLPPGMGYAWTGMSFQEKSAGGQAGLLFVLAIVTVFLILAAQYESWTTPLAVIISIPLSVLGAMLFLMWRGMDNNVFTQVGLILLVGLAAKNAILIVEFAREARLRGASLHEAALEATSLRFRPILMTSFAFILGCVPLMLASGAGANGRQAIGTAVVGGMLLGTMLTLVFTPVLYVGIQTVAERFRPVVVKEESQ